MKCSVLLPVYKAGPLLKDTIRSILSQTEDDFEFLIIDDASPDGSADLIRSFAASDKRIRAVYHDRNAGLASTLNEGLAVASSELVVRIDQDDLALPDRLATQLKFMADHPAVAIAGSFVYHMGRTPARDRLVRLPVSHDEIVETLPKYNCLYHPSVIMRRSEVQGLGGYRAEYKNAEDYDLWLRASKRCRLANIPTPLLRYRFSTGGMTLGKKWEQAHFAQMAVLSYYHPDWSQNRVRSEASIVLEKQGKEWFLEQVVRGTIEELANLGMFGDALHVFWLFWRQIGFARASRVALDFWRKRFQSRS